MGESFKSVCGVIIIISLVAAVFSWLDETPSNTVKALRSIAPLVCVITIGLLLKIHSRRDIVPDYLIELNQKFFNRAGFCFSFNATSIKGICYLVAYFQNQFDHPCLGRIALRPARGFWLSRAKINTIGFDISCDGGSFGIARIPIPVAKESQGKKIKFEVGASVDYPKGKGRRLRFRDGLFLRTNSKFSDTFGTAITIAGTMSGSIVLKTPATVTMQFPLDVLEEIHLDIKPEIRSLWKYGDPPLGGGVLNAISNLDQINQRA